MTTTSELSRTLRTLLPAGGTVALGDGVGAIRTLEDGRPVGAVLSDAARQIGGVRLVLGWMPAPLYGIDPDAFADVIALMPGWGLRDLLLCPPARFVPTPLSAIPALLAGSLRPDVLITRLVDRSGRLHFGTEVSWQRGLVESGVPVLAIIDTTAPTASAEAPVDPEQVTLVGRTGDGPIPIPDKEPEPVHEALADAVLRFVPEGARLQYGPGQLGTALLSRTTVPLRIDTGLLTDAVVDLDKRGLLAATPSASYLLGSETLYNWADGKPILRGIEHTHDITRLSRSDPFIAVNTAIEIDPVGQINVEGVGDNVFGGIGGHPDYCAAASCSRGGLSIIAVPSSYKGRSPLVQALSRPASTPAYHVDLIVTESGCADLRGADWPRRRNLITDLFSNWEQATDA
ncbi:butyrate:acetyl-CoA coenzyme A-transferase [Mycobacterium heckeshornense]|uniref:acetyl-CoA hydrolase/transferase C-terminal domain-containing protein n=1 Tax=Mycobacterium heckeshornense TaxID=110505 RepID=UPI001AFC62C2|nr:acetyl-CoA hydrolase/transferase C-terminal domain-containing protein [Mycobacterium heckeshornense]BCQ07349.1 butyrate:acetyl-CoA coenzyme A-transferase [Mycobacterium heckeshornense]